MFHEILPFDNEATRLSAQNMGEDPQLSVLAFRRSLALYDEVYIILVKLLSRKNAIHAICHFF